MKVRVFKPFIKRKDMDSVLTCIVSDTIGEGHELKRFIDLAKERFGFDYGTALREPSRALSFALAALQLPPGSGVIISPLSPSYYLAVIASQGCHAVFADVSLRSGSLAKGSVEEMASKGARAIIAHETFGIVPDLSSVVSLGLPIIEDITQSIGANNGEKKAGDTGTYVIVSMEDSDLITAGGGALLFAKERKNAALLRKALESASPDSFLSDLNASLASTQMKSLDSSLAKRREIAQAYSRALSSSRHAMPQPDGDGEASFWSFPVFLADGMKDASAYAQKKEIETKSAFDSCTLAVAARDDGQCPNARSLMLRSLLFPLYPGIGKTQAEKVAKVLGTLP
jgi:perosamine synthetase